MTLAGNGPFGFGQAIADGATYAVTLLTQLAGQTCSVNSGSGSVDSSGDAIDTVNVTCVSTSSIGGTVTGLSAGTSVTLSDGTVLLPIAIDGDFAFPGLLLTSAADNVTVVTQPQNGVCTLQNAGGTVSEGASVAVVVSCSPAP